MRKKIMIIGLIGTLEKPDGSKEKGLELIDVIAQVQAATGDGGLDVYIDSPGGNPDVAFAIKDYLLKVDPNYTSIIQSLCGSAATVISLGAKPENRKMMANGRFFIHNPSLLYVSGDADALARMSDYIREEETKFAKYYAKTTGQPLEAITPLMKVETEMNAEQAKQMGFITEIIPALMPVAFITKTKPASADIPTIMKEKLKKLQGLMAAALKEISGDEPVKKKITLKNAKAIKEANSVQALLDLTTKDGINVVVETESDVPSIGDLVTADGQPAPDGKYSFDQGILIVANGAITDILPPDASTGATAAAAAVTDTPEVTALKLQVTNLTTERDQLKARMTENEQALDALTTQFETIARQMETGYTPPKKGAARNPAGNKGKQGKESYFAKLLREADEKKSAAKS